jgi:hypothetical protein
MIHPHADPAGVRRFVVDAEGNDLAPRLVGKVVALYLLGLPRGLPLTPAIAELADQLLLCGSDRHHGLPPLLEGLGPAVDVLKLRLPIRVGATRTRLPIGLETGAQVMEKAVDGPLTHRMPWACSAAANWAALLPVHRSRDIGSPRGTGSPKVSGPERGADPPSSWLASPLDGVTARGSPRTRSSAWQDEVPASLRMVTRDRPVALGNAADPPSSRWRGLHRRPGRQARSSTSGLRMTNFAAMAWCRWVLQRADHHTLIGEMAVILASLSVSRAGETYAPEL